MKSAEREQLLRRPGKLSRAARDSDFVPWHPHVHMLTSRATRWPEGNVCSLGRSQHLWPLKLQLRPDAPSNQLCSVNTPNWKIKVFNFFLHWKKLGYISQYISLLFHKLQVLAFATLTRAKERKHKHSKINARRDNTVTDSSRGLEPVNL